MAGRIYLAGKKRRANLRCILPRFLSNGDIRLLRSSPNLSITRSGVRGNSWNQISAASWSEAAKEVAFISCGSALIFQYQFLQNAGQAIFVAR
jgi:hypothetical protein